MRTFLLDLRVAVRLLRDSPWLSTACIVTLALGIGANTTIYSFADAVLFLFRVCRPMEWKVPSPVFAGWFSQTMVQFSMVLVKVVAT